jgi:hypothetical protein
MLSFSVPICKNCVTFSDNVVINFLVEAVMLMKCYEAYVIFNLVFRILYCTGMTYVILHFIADLSLTVLKLFGTSLNPQKHCILLIYLELEYLPAFVSVSDWCLNL